MNICKYLMERTRSRAKESERMSSESPGRSLNKHDVIRARTQSANTSISIQIKVLRDGQTLTESKHLSFIR